jgi:hypothetical protein
VCWSKQSELSQGSVLGIELSMGDYDTPRLRHRPIIIASQPFQKSEPVRFPSPLFDQ